MEYIQRMKDMPGHVLFSKHEKTHLLSTYQRECLRRFDKGCQLEQDAYLIKHPEIMAMMVIQFASAINTVSHQESLKFVAQNLTKPYDELDKAVRALLKIAPDKPYYEGPIYSDKSLMTDLVAIRNKYNPIILEDVIADDLSSIPTKSSSFVSIATSRSTLATPEPTPIPSPTMSEIFYGAISKIVDKATLLNVQPYDVLYDTAYVELMKAVENAMEITVREIKEDIVAEINMAYEKFTKTIVRRAQLLAELNWERRMRKKLKRTLRREKSFKGYETPTTPKSVLSSHESYKVPPPPPCKCHPQFYYNRYPKDRFGIYLPQANNFSSKNITAPPLMPGEHEPEAKPS